jgi:hypothetical protein
MWRAKRCYIAGTAVRVDDDRCNYMAEWRKQQTAAKERQQKEAEEEAKSEAGFEERRRRLLSLSSFRARARKTRSGAALGGGRDSGSSDILTVASNVNASARLLLADDNDNKNAIVEDVEKTINGALGRVEECTVMQPCEGVFMWRASKWTSCTRACGGGERKRDIKCHDTGTGGVVDDSNCSAGVREQFPSIETCNNAACGVFWKGVDDWQPCMRDKKEVTCGGGMRTRKITCASRETPFPVSPDGDGACAELGDRPAKETACAADACPVWVTAKWQACVADTVDDTTTPSDSDDVTKKDDGTKKDYITKKNDVAKKKQAKRERYYKARLACDSATPPAGTQTRDVSCVNVLGETFGDADCSDR